MAIKGLSSIRRISRGGYLRLGEKVRNSAGKEYPKAIDYFLADFDDPDNEAIFTRLYGEKPKRVTVCLAYDTQDECFPQFYKCYGASGLKCKGDGESADRWIDGALVEGLVCDTPIHCDFAMENKDKSGKPGCKQSGSLQFFIKGIPGLQIFQINTTSRNSFININTAIGTLTWLRSGKSIRGVWFDLVVRPHETMAEGKKKTVFVLDAVLPVSLDDAHKLRSAIEVPTQLPAPDESKDPLLYPEDGFEPEGEGQATETSEPVNVTAEPVSLGDDPDIVAAFDAAGCSETQRAAMLRSADESNWTKAQLMNLLTKKAAERAKQSTPIETAKPTETAKPATTRTRTTPARTQEPVAANAGGNDGTNDGFNF